MKFNIRIAYILTRLILSHRAEAVPNGHHYFRGTDAQLGSNGNSSSTPDEFFGTTIKQFSYTAKSMIQHSPSRHLRSPMVSPHHLERMVEEVPTLTIVNSTNYSGNTDKLSTTHVGNFESPIAPFDEIIFALEELAKLERCPDECFSEMDSGGGMMFGRATTYFFFRMLESMLVDFHFRMIVDAW